MTRLITTTALALILAVPAAAQVQQQQDPQALQNGAQMGMNGEFRDTMQMGDFLASELIDAPIYAPATAQDRQQQLDPQQQPPQQQQQLDPQQQQPAPDQQQQQLPPEQQPQLAPEGQVGQAGRWRQPISAAELGDLEYIGNVSDLLLDEQGNIQGVLVDVGGFLGIGQRQIAISLARVTFAADVEDPTQIYVVSSIGADALENAPEFVPTAEGRGMQRAQDMQQQQVQPDQQQPLQQQQVQPDQQQQDLQQQQLDQDRQFEFRGDREPIPAPEIQREGFQQVQLDEISIDDLIGSDVRDPEGDDIGTISDVVIGSEGEARYVVIEFGGFLGLGTRSVAVGFDELTILTDEGMADFQVYINMTEEMLEAMPEHTQN